MTKSKGKSESSVDKEAVLDCSRLFRMVLFRNNVGAYKDPKTGRWVRYGLANESKEMNQHTKSSDRVGWTPIEITPEMVGKTVPVFTSIEMKKGGYKPSGKAELDHIAAQQRFCDTVTRAGGIAGIVDSAEKAVDLVKNWLTGMKG